MRAASATRPPGPPAFGGQLRDRHAVSPVRHLFGLVDHRVEGELGSVRPASLCLLVGLDALGAHGGAIPAVAAGGCVCARRGRHARTGRGRMVASSSPRVRLAPTVRARNTSWVPAHHLFLPLAAASPLARPPSWPFRLCARRAATGPPPLAPAAHPVSPARRRPRSADGLRAMWPQHTPMRPPRVRPLLRAARARVRARRARARAPARAHHPSPRPAD